ncbi:MAG: HesA/MoeB/ThiF family protein [Candidatus Geothermincolia bacterium]
MDDSALLESLRSAATNREEGCGVMRCLSAESIALIAAEKGVTTREVSIFALEHGLVPLRYVKNIGTVGLEGQARLLASRVMLVGAGGIGGAAAEMLARMGAGTLVLVDPDVFDETNLNRQNFCCADVLGLAKVDVVGGRIEEINGDVLVVRHRLQATAETLPGLLPGADVVIDALDSIDDRLVLQAACATAGVAMVHGAIAGTALQATTVFPGDTGLTGFAPTGDSEGKARGMEVETGNPATTPAMCAAIQVQEAVRVILGGKNALRGRMLFLDMDEWTVDFIDL